MVDARAAPVLGELCDNSPPLPLAGNSVTVYSTSGAGFKHHVRTWYNIALSRHLYTFSQASSPMRRKDGAAP